MHNVVDIVPLYVWWRCLAPRGSSPELSTEKINQKELSPVSGFQFCLKPKLF